MSTNSSCSRRPFLRRLASTAIAASVLMGAASIGAAQATEAYPSRPITLVLAYPPGGGVDLVGRLIARYLEASLNQTVVVENRPGAGSVIGTSVVTRAKPDGYTLLLADPALIINPSLMKSIPYNVKSDLVPISTVTVSPLVLVVPQQSNNKTVNDLVAAGKDNAKGLNYGSAGIGTTPHMAGELLKARTSSNLVHIPYKGSGPAMTDLVAGELDFAFATQPAAAQYIEQGRLHGLATTGEQRSKRLPDLPTIHDTVPGFNVQFWTALFAPAGTPPDILEKLSAAVQQAHKTPEFIATLEKAGENPAFMSLSDSAAFVEKEEQMWKKVVEDGKLQQE
jgi:tripartite-type tricarboxylate transporter receptor subunit TctC